MQLHTKYGFFQKPNSMENLFSIFQYPMNRAKSLRIQLATAWLITAAFAVLLSACGGSHSKHAYKLYPGPVLPDSDVATLKFGNRVHAVEIDGLTVSSADYGEIKLKPGPHTIRWGTKFIVSVLINSSGFDSAIADNDVTLAAGHTYSIEADRTTGHGYRMYLWIEDAETGQVVAGTKKP